MSATLAAAALAVTMRLVASHGYPDGAPPGFSGGFKEDSCHACHFHEALNAAPGKIAIGGVPARYTPGERYSVTVTLTRTGMKRVGFQLAARFKADASQAGRVEPAPPDAERVGVETESGIQYAGQQEAGSAASGDVATWTIVWVAPDRGGAVVFDVAANAANGDGTAEGDFVYTTRAEAAPP